MSGYSEQLITLVVGDRPLHEVLAAELTPGTTFEVLEEEITTVVRADGSEHTKTRYTVKLRKPNWIPDR